MKHPLKTAASGTSIQHILIVEDEAHLAIGIKYNLQAEGYRVTVAGDGPIALKLVEDQPDDVDLIILDLMLPGMSGYAVCEAVRDAGNNVPILMLSARTLSEDRIRGFNVGTDQYLEKPFELDELISRVRNLLARGASRAARAANNRTVGDTYNFGGGRVKINFDTFEVTVDGELLRLTAMEMNLLRYFAENEGSVVSRAQLLDNVWGMSSSPTTRTVDNFIVRMRRYFEVDPGEPRHFVSVRGAGYQFIAEPNHR